MKKLQILLLEDDIILSEIVEEFLCSLGYKVSLAYNGKVAEELVYREQFDLLILDVNVPYVDGFEFLKSLRELHNTTPAIFITSLNDIQDMRDGFGVGADDYIKKPFDLSELELRIDNIKRHFKLEDDVIEISKDITLDVNKLLVTVKGEEKSISNKEAHILNYLQSNHQRVISIDEIGVNIYEYEQIPSDTTIRTYIKNIRKLIGEAYITNIKGVGYRFNKK